MKPGKPRVYDPATIAYIEYLENEVEHLRKKIALKLKQPDRALELADQAKSEDTIEPYRHAEKVNYGTNSMCYPVAGKLPKVPQEKQ